MGVGLGDEDFFVGECEGLGGDLAEDGVGALAELGGGDEDTGAAFGGESMSTTELRRRSPEPVKPAPWKKVAKPMPRLMVLVGFCLVELRRVWRGSWIL